MAGRAEKSEVGIQKPDVIISQVVNYRTTIAAQRVFLVQRKPTKPAIHREQFADGSAVVTHTRTAVC